MVTPRRSLDRVPPPLRCPWCGSGFTSRSRGREAWFCHSCWRVFREAAEVSYDFVADGWTDALGALQGSGDIITVRLPYGFIGVCMISVDPVPRRRHSTRREVVSR